MCPIRWHSTWMFAVVLIQLSDSFLAPQELTFLVISQKEPKSIRNAERLRSSILLQAQIEAAERNIEVNRVQQPQIILSHEAFNGIGSWAITPILASSSEHIENILSTSSKRRRRGSSRSNSSNDDDSEGDGSSGSTSTAATTTTKTKWLILCEDQSIVDLKALINNLEMEDYTKDVFLGYPLRDSEATIIHHFAFFENPSWFLYPLFKAGVAISIPLLKNLTERVRNEKISSDFFIDASHELSLFAWNNGRGHKLSRAPYFCVGHRPPLPSPQPSLSSSGNGCAIYFGGSDEAAANDESIEGGSSGGSEHTQLYPTPASSKTTTTKTGAPSNSSASITINNILFAVKTWSKNHVERLPIIQRTWGAVTPHICYFSDKYDPSIPTVKCSVENTDTGHCAKTLSIFKYIVDELDFNQSLTAIKWIVLADDDTLLSTTALTKYLNTFDPNAHIYLGERYGYQLLSSTGFDYITGGGSIVFSISVLRKLVAYCRCPSPSSPDDMIIALCLQRVGIEPIHSPKFHQARPMDYPPEYLIGMEAISFHKFWQIDPFYIYEKWLGGTVKTDPTIDDAMNDIVYESTHYDGHCSNEQQQIERQFCERHHSPNTAHCEDVNKKIEEKHVDL